MRIAFTTPSISQAYTGISEVAYQLSKSLTEKNVDVTVYSFRDRWTDTALKKWGHTRPALFEPLSIFKYPVSTKINRCLKNSDANIIHVQSLWCSSIIGVNQWKKKNRRPTVLSSNGYLDGWALAQSRLKKALALKFGVRSFLENSDCIVLNNNAEITDARSLGLRQSIAVIPGGVQIPAPNSTWDDPIWKIDSCEDDRKVLLYLGRIHPKKGVDILLRAWATVEKKAELCGWRLVLVGFSDAPSKYEEICRDFVLSNNLHRSVSLYNGVFDHGMHACYANASAFILPSFSEGTPVAALHSLAHAKPTLLTKYCNIDSHNLGKFGLDIEPNIKSLESSLIELFESTNQHLTAWGNNALNTAACKYSWSKIVDQYISLYFWLDGQVTQKPDFVEGHT